MSLRSPPGTNPRRYVLPTTLMLILACCNHPPDAPSERQPDRPVRAHTSSADRSPFIGDDTTSARAPVEDAILPASTSSLAPPRAAAPLAESGASTAPVRQMPATRRSGDPYPALEAPSVESPHYVDLRVNGRRLDTIVPVRNRDGIQLREEDLLAAGVRFPATAPSDSGWVALSSLPGASVTYDPTTLVVDLHVPPDWLPAQRFGRLQPDGYAVEATPGAVLNYDAYYRASGGNGDIASVWLEQRVFGRFGVLSNTGAWRSSWGGTGTAKHVRYDSTWWLDRHDRLSTWMLGDVINGGHTWTRPVRIGGFRFARDFALRPDLITYPLPELSGQAALPTTVDLLINGKLAASRDVEPGPYTFAEIPFVSGAGEAALIATDAAGRQTITTAPFYVSSELLKPGLLDYDVSAGALREAYGLRSFAYGEWAGSGSLRYGIRDDLTLESHVELANGLTALGVGGAVKAGLAGVLQAGAMRSSHRNERGWQYSLGYRYASPRFVLAYQQMRRSGEFMSLASLGDKPVGPDRFRHLSLSVPAGLSGRIGISFFDASAPQGQQTRLVNLGYSRPWRSAATLHVAAVRDLERSTMTASVQFVATFGGRGTMRMGATARDSAAVHSVDFVRRSSPSGGLGWNASYGLGADERSYRQAGMSYGGRFARIDAGIHRASGLDTSWAGASGSVVAMGGQILPTRRIGDAFVVVTTDGVPDVPVRYENQAVGRTDRNGRLIVPWSSPNYAAKYEVDPLDLPPDVHIDEVDRRLAVRRGTGALLRFPIRRATSATLAILDESGQPLPLGSVAVQAVTGRRAYVGHDGIAYFEDLPPGSRLEIIRPDGAECHAELELEADSWTSGRTVPVVCR